MDLGVCRGISVSSFRYLVDRIRYTLRFYGFGCITLSSRLCDVHMKVRDIPNDSRKFFPCGLASYWQLRFSCDSFNHGCGGANKLAAVNPLLTPKRGE